ncbi:GNAT family N-acetyltransferase [archaeon]|jgi:GNAT superfamily N-acetyltransferase|nr:GNAT family N-acetyltransferase [archaeon]MBT4241295.1 GNAT family N-acetyltransferase [archaeon]MBT4418117.1 GNAT family N-acetyltransferase [archaeon]
MIVEFEERYKAQVWPNLDNENRKLFKNSLFKKFLFVEKNIVKGWILLQPSKDRLLLDWIFVLEEFQKQKIGTKLLDHVKKFAKNKNFRGISVNTGSQTNWARIFYEKNGFKQVGSVKKFFKFDKEHIFYWFEV